MPYAIKHWAQFTGFISGIKYIIIIYCINAFQPLMGIFTLFDTKKHGIANAIGIKYTVSVRPAGLMTGP